jgi:Trypsin
MRGLLASTALLATCGAAVPEEPRKDIASRSSAVVRGDIDPVRAEVFFLMIRDSEVSNGFYACTGTLIGPHTLLTAAHCLSCLTEPLTIDVTNQQHPFDSLGGRFSPSLTTIRGTAWRRHPGYGEVCSGGQSPEADLDIGLIQLASAPSVSPRSWADTPPETAPVLLVGYGKTGNTGEFGRRRSGLDRVVALTDRTMLNRGTPSATCFGDSGGPLLSTDGGVEQVVGVVSLGDLNCDEGGIAARVDVAADFIRTTLADFESGPCLADGVCSDQCPDRGTDPDCPESCSPGGLCSAAACPSPDPDCAPLGVPCISGEQCDGKLCVTDPQHLEAYCSKTCSGDGDCAGGFVCEGSACRHPQRPVVPLGSPCNGATEACAGGGLCISLGGGPSTCRAECDIRRDCASGVCLVDAGVVGTGVCGEALTATTPDAGTKQQSSSGTSQSGCSAGSGGAVPGLFLLLTLWLAALRRSRTARPPQ